MRSRASTSLASRCLPTARTSDYPHWHPFLARYRNGIATSGLKGRTHPHFSVTGGAWLGLRRPPALGTNLTERKRGRSGTVLDLLPCGRHRHRSTTESRIEKSGTRAGHPILVAAGPISRDARDLRYFTIRYTRPFPSTFLAFPRKEAGWTG